MRREVFICGSFLTDDLILESRRNLTLSSSLIGDWYCVVREFENARDLKQATSHSDYVLGTCYLWGMNAVVIDESRAITLFVDAILAGSPDASSLLAECALKGRGMSIDRELAGTCLVDTFLR